MISDFVETLIDRLKDTTAHPTLKHIYKGLDVRVDEIFIPLKLEIQEKGSKISKDFEEWIVEDHPDRYVLIWGDPGAGKTTLIQKTAHSLASNFKKHKIIPIFVRVRNWSKQQDFRDFINAELANLLGRNLSDNPVEELFSEAAKLSARLYIFMDGLDELPSDFSIREAGKKLKRSDISPKFSKIIVTARSRSQGNEFFDGKHYVIKLEQLSRGEVNALFDKWMALLKEKTTISFDDEKIREFLIDDEIISPISNNPLLMILSIIWFLTAELEAESSMGELMNTLVKKLLRDWDEIRGVKFQRKYTIDAYLEIFEKLALAEMENLRLRIEDNPPSPAVISDGHLILDKALADELKRRGVFVRFEDDGFRFINNFFRDYFVARYLTKEPVNYARYFALKLFDRNWHNAFLTAFYLTADVPYKAFQFLSVLMDTYNPFDNALIVRLRIAAECMRKYFKYHGKQDVNWLIIDRLREKFMENYERFSRYLPEARTGDFNFLRNVFYELRKEECGFYEKLLDHLSRQPKKEERQPARSGEKREYRSSKLLLSSGKAEAKAGGEVEVSVIKKAIKEIAKARNEAERRTVREKYPDVFRKDDISVKAESQEDIINVFKIAKDVLENLDLKAKEPSRNAAVILALLERPVQNYPESVPDSFVNFLVVRLYQTSSEDLGDFRSAAVNFIKDTDSLGTRLAQILALQLAKENNIPKEKILTLEGFESNFPRDIFKSEDIIRLFNKNVGNMNKPAAVVIYDFLFALLEVLEEKDLTLDDRVRLLEVLCKILTKPRHTEENHETV